MAQQKRISLASMRTQFQPLAFLTSVTVSCGVGGRCGSDLQLLWPWHKPAAAAPFRPLAWEPPYAVSAALKRQKIYILAFQVYS